MFSSGTAGSHDTRRRVVVRGIVQGVGFRPHVYALARQLGLAGCVWNNGHGVVAEVEGAPADVEAFCSRVDVEAPPLALVTGIDSQPITPVGGTDFTIRESEHRTWPHVRATRRHDLRRLPGRPARPGQPPPPAPLRHVHQLRTAVHHHDRPAL